MQNASIEVGGGKKTIEAVKRRVKHGMVEVITTINHYQHILGILKILLRIVGKWTREILHIFLD